MPELPEVETTLRGIEPHIINKKITKLVVRQAQLRWPVSPELSELLPQAAINKIQRRGKYLLLSNKLGTAIIHLGMSGSLRVIPAATPIGKHDHVDMVLANNTIIRYTDPRRFGCWLWSTTPFEHKLIAKLGPEPLSDAFNVAYIYKLAKQRRVVIKQLLMNAHIVVGVGNIYANEALFQAGISPLRPSNTLSEATFEILVPIIKEILIVAISQGGTTLKDFTQTDGKPGYFAQQLQVYGRGGSACMNCKTILSEVRLSGRTTVFCEQCQQ